MGNCFPHILKVTQQIKQGELSYKERLIHLDLLPLTYDLEVKDLVFLYRALYGHVDIDISFIIRVLVTALLDDLNQVI